MVGSIMCCGVTKLLEEMRSKEKARILVGLLYVEIFVALARLDKMEKNNRVNTSAQSCDFR